MLRTGTIKTHESGGDLVIEWQIPRFSTLRKTDGAGYRSPSFSFGGARWILGIFPNGWSGRDSSGHVDLYLEKYYSGRSITQSFFLSLKTAKGERHKEEHYTRDFQNFPESMHALRRFISRPELSRLRSELMPDDVLTVVCAMRRSTSAKSESDSASAEISNSDSESDSAEISNSDSKSDCAEISAPASDSAGCFSNSGKCRHCRGNFAAGILSSHQRKCMQRPVKCPDCLKVVVLQKWFDEHECQLERSEAENSGSNCVETSTQTGELNGEESENTCVEAFTQTGEENGEESGNICMEAFTQTGEENAETSKNTLKESFTQTEEINADEWFKEKSKTACVDASTQTEKQDVSLISPPEENDLMTDFKDLLKESRGIDVTFKVDTLNSKTELFAHQLILALRSPYFADLFYGQGTKKGHQIIPLTGINTKAFEQMIRYCYDYKPCLQTTEDACALFKVASEFKVISLQNLCHTFFRHTKIEPGNVFTVLKISVEMEDKNLQDMCYHVLQEQTREVMAAYTLYDVTPAMVYTLLNLPKLSLNSEYDLIKWIFDWSNIKSKDTNSSCKSTRDYLANFLQNMNFLALSIKEFVMLIKDNPEFFNSDEIASVSMNIAIPGSREMPVWHNKDLKRRVYTGSNE